MRASQRVFVCLFATSNPRLLYKYDHLNWIEIPVESFSLSRFSDLRVSERRSHFERIENVEAEDCGGRESMAANAQQSRRPASLGVRSQAWLSGRARADRTGSRTLPQPPIRSQTQLRSAPAHSGVYESSEMIHFFLALTEYESSPACFEIACLVRI